jgi:hypothetical protein
MIFALLTFLSAFLIEGIGTYVSIVGLSALFSSNPVIIMLALALDFGKLITVSFLYKHWKSMNKIMKAYMLAAASILMIITSTGAAGYLSAEFQKAIVSTKEGDIRVAALKEEKTKLEARKKEIDSQIANLPPNMVKGRQKLINEFKTEIAQVNTRITEIDKTLPEIEVEKAHADSHAGPILYVAKAFDTTVEEAVKYVILLIIFVFDPLAVVLIIGGNFLVDQNKREKKEREAEIATREEEDRQRRYQIEMDEIRHRHEIEEEKVEIEKLHMTSQPIKDEIVAEEIHAAHPEIVTEDFVTLHPEDKRNKGTHVTELPKDIPTEEVIDNGPETTETVQEEVVAEITPEAGTDVQEVQEEKVKEVIEAIPDPIIDHVTEETPTPEGLPEPIVQDTVVEELDEPVPAVETEEQLDVIAQQPVTEITVIEFPKTEEPVVEEVQILSTSLDGVSTAKADVILNDSHAEVPSSVLKLYK